MDDEMRMKRKAGGRLQSPSLQLTTICCAGRFCIHLAPAKKHSAVIMYMSTESLYKQNGDMVVAQLLSISSNKQKLSKPK